MSASRRVSVGQQKGLCQPAEGCLLASRRGYVSQQRGVCQSAEGGLFVSSGGSFIRCERNQGLTPRRQGATVSGSLQDFAPSRLRVRKERLGWRRLGVVLVLLLELVLDGAAYGTHGKRGRDRREVVKVAAGRIGGRDCIPADDRKGASRGRAGDGRQDGQE